MLSILIPKLILKGAIKSYIVKPLLTASASIIPSKVVCDASLLGYHSQVLISDLYKFGADQLLDKFIDKKLDFKIKKLTKYQFEVEPNNEWARLFLQLSDFSTSQKVILDMRKFEKEIEILTHQAMLELEGLENQIDEHTDAILGVINDDMEEIDSILTHQINKMNNLVIVDRKIKSIEEQNKKKPVVKLS